MPVDLAGLDPFGGALASPFALLRESAIDANIAAMQQWCTAHEVELAPHGKTTMSPDLFVRQLEAGAWGLTVASPAQARVAVAAGAARILIANEVTDGAGIAWLGRARRDHPDVLLICYVDSLDGVALLEDGLAGVLADGERFHVLAELGLPGGRTGARTEDEVHAIARRVADGRHLRLIGVSGYEGVAASLGGADAPTAAEAFGARLGALAVQLVADGLIAPSPDRPVILSAGGSAWFDHVVPALRSARDRLGEVPAVVVLRSGAYVTHDHGLYSHVTPRPAAVTDRHSLRPSRSGAASCPGRSRPAPSSTSAAETRPSIRICRSPCGAGRTPEDHPPPSRPTWSNSTTSTHSWTCRSRKRWRWAIGSVSASRTRAPRSTSGTCSCWSTTRTGSSTSCPRSSDFAR
jgi:D-serine deaminase-like pyridoxal phosphate-dependent protein